MASMVPRIQQKQEQLQLHQEIKTLFEKAEKDVHQVRHLRSAMLAGTTMPARELSFDASGEMLWLGKPFEEAASTSDRMKLIILVGSLEDPAIRVILLYEGSLIDRKGIEDIAAWSSYAGYQVIIEQVRDEPDKGSNVFHIVDGEVAATE